MRKTCHRPLQSKGVLLSALAMYFQLSSLGSHPPLSGYGGESVRICGGFGGGTGEVGGAGVGSGGIGNGCGGEVGELLREIVVSGGVSCCWKSALFLCSSRG